MPLLSRRALLASSALPIMAQSSGIVVAILKSDHAVALVDPRSLRILGKISTGEGPHEVCTIGSKAYVGIYGVAGRPGRELAEIDLLTRKELRRYSLQPLLSPHGLVNVGRYIYFTAERSRAVGRFDTETRALDWTMGTGQFATHMIVASPDGRKLYTTNILDNTVSSIEVVASKAGPPRLTQIRVGEKPEGIAITPDGREVWAGHNTDGQISIIDTSTDQVTQTIPASKMAFRLAFTSDGATCVVAGATGEEVVLIDARSREIRQRIATPGSVPQGILISPDNQWLFVATGPALLRIDLEKAQLSGSCEPGGGVDGLAWSNI